MEPSKKPPHKLSDARLVVQPTPVERRKARNRRKQDRKLFARRYREMCIERSLQR